MSGPHESSQDNSSADQERVLGEPSNYEQSQHGDDPVPSPGSVPLFREGGFKFPKALLEGGGSGILSNPIAFGLQEYLLSESIFDVNTSIEGVILFMLRNALDNKGKIGLSCYWGFLGFPVF